MFHPIAAAALITILSKSVSFGVEKVRLNIHERDLMLSKKRLEAFLAVDHAKATQLRGFELLLYVITGGRKYADKKQDLEALWLEFTKKNTAVAPTGVEDLNDAQDLDDTVTLNTNNLGDEDIKNVDDIFAKMVTFGKIYNYIHPDEDDVFNFHVVFATSEFGMCETVKFMIGNTCVHECDCNKTVKDELIHTRIPEKKGLLPEKLNIEKQYGAARENCDGRELIVSQINGLIDKLRLLKGPAVWEMFEFQKLYNQLNKGKLDISLIESLIINIDRVICSRQGNANNANSAKSEVVKNIPQLNALRSDLIKLSNQLKNTSSVFLKKYDFNDVLETYYVNNKPFAEKPGSSDKERESQELGAGCFGRVRRPVVGVDKYIANPMVDKNELFPIQEHDFVKELWGLSEEEYQIHTAQSDIVIRNLNLLDSDGKSKTVSVNRVANFYKYKLELKPENIAHIKYGVVYYNKKDNTIEYKEESDSATLISKQLPDKFSDISGLSGLNEVRKYLYKEYPPTDKKNRLEPCLTRKLVGSTLNAKNIQKVKVEQINANVDIKIAELGGAIYKLEQVKRNMFFLEAKIDTLKKLTGVRFNSDQASSELETIGYIFSNISKFSPTVDDLDSTLAKLNELSEISKYLNIISQVGEKRSIILKLSQLQTLIGKVNDTITGLGQQDLTSENVEKLTEQLEGFTDIINELKTIDRPISDLNRKLSQLEGLQPTIFNLKKQDQDVYTNIVNNVKKVIGFMVLPLRDALTAGLFNLDAKIDNMMTVLGYDIRVAEQQPVETHFSGDIDFIIYQNKAYYNHPGKGVLLLNQLELRPNDSSEQINQLQQYLYCLSKSELVVGIPKPTKMVGLYRIDTDADLVARRLIVSEKNLNRESLKNIYIKLSHITNRKENAGIDSAGIFDLVFNNVLPDEQINIEALLRVQGLFGSFYTMLNATHYFLSGETHWDASKCGVVSNGKCDFQYLREWLDDTIPDDIGKLMHVPDNWDGDFKQDLIEFLITWKSSTLDIVNRDSQQLYEFMCKFNSYVVDDLQDKLKALNVNPINVAAETENGGTENENSHSSEDLSAKNNGGRDLERQSRSMLDFADDDGYNTELYKHRHTRMADIFLESAVG